VKLLRCILVCRPTPPYIQGNVLVAVAGPVVHGGRDEATARRMSAAVPVHPEDAPRPPPGPRRQPGHVLPHEDFASVRVREAPPGDGVGRVLPRRQDQRHSPAAHLVPPVSTMSSLLPS